MTAHDIDQFSEIMTGLAENFNGKLSDPGLDMRFAALSEFSIEQVRTAAMACVRSRKYFSMPTIAEIVEHIVGSKDDHKIQGEAQAQEVLMAVRRYGVYATVQFADPVTNAVVKQFFGGWPQLCSRKEDDHVWFVKDFATHYADYKMRGVENTEPLRGIGTNEKVEMIGKSSQFVLEGNSAGRGKVAAVVSGVTFKQRQAFRDGAPLHDIVEKDSAA